MGFVAYSVELAYQKMLKDKKDDASLHIPKDFGEFVQKKEFKKLLQHILEYCRVGHAP